MKKASSKLKTVIVNLLGVLFVFVIALNLFWLGKFLYFPAIEKKQVSETLPLDKFSKTIKPSFGSDHFHILDEKVYDRAVENAQICLQCHGNFAHLKHKEYRAYYNMHTFFLACETCHLRLEKEDKGTGFKWLDDKTGKPLEKLVGKDGNFGAKIVPVRKLKFGFERLDKFPDEYLAKEFMKNKSSYTEAEKEKICGQLMKWSDEEPISCDECHSKTGYLNYHELLYDNKRSEELSRIEIVKMLQEYKEFHFPKIFNQ
jgi:hypothetical protein